MLARRPTTTVTRGRLVVRTAIEAADGTELAPLEVALALGHADLLDPTATPALPVLAVLAAARGEDLVVEGSADRAAAEAAAALAGALAARWEVPAPRIEVAMTHDAPAGRPGVGLLFSRGTDSWSALVASLDGPAEDRVTHLLAVLHADDGRVVDDRGSHEWAARAQVVEGHRRAAAELGLPLVVVSSNARALLDGLRPRPDTAGFVLVSAGLGAAAGLGRIVLGGDGPGEARTGTGWDPALLGSLSTPAVEVRVQASPLPLHDRLATLAADPRVGTWLRPCRDEDGVEACGTCPECLLSRSCPLMGEGPGAEGPGDGSIDVDLVRAVVVDPEIAVAVDALVDGLPPRHERLRRAWIDARSRSRDEASPPRWGDWDVPGLAGPGVPQRVATALRAATGHPDVPAEQPLGWRPGAVPLRPSVADHRRIRALAAQGPHRPHAWAVVEHQVRADRADGHQTALALRSFDAHGPGLVYLPGVLWDPTQPPALDPDAVGRLLRAARTRLWWRPDGDLEPLRIVESVEHGCLPLQVMPAGPARALALDLPPALAALVVADDDLAGVDLSPDAVAARLAPVVDLLLAGSAEHGLLAGATGVFGG